jgi:hypothetical protein
MTTEADWQCAPNLILILGCGDFLDKGLGSGSHISNSDLRVNLATNACHELDWHAKLSDTRGLRCEQHGRIIKNG